MRQLIRATAKSIITSQGACPSSLLSDAFDFVDTQARLVDWCDQDLSSTVNSLYEMIPVLQTDGTQQFRVLSLTEFMVNSCATWV